MSRNKRILSNDRTTKAKKNKVVSIEAIRCEKLLQILRDRSSRFLIDCKKFSDASNNFVTYCTGYKGKTDMYESILKIFESYITVYVYFWKQYIYLNYGICSFQYQFQESLDKIITVRNTLKHETSAYIDMFIREGGQNYLTDASLEGIYNFYASNKLKDDDFLTILEATVKVDLQEAEKAITTSVEKVTENLNMMRVTKKHLLLVPRFKTPASVNFEYHYEECYQKKSDVKTIILKKGGSQISGFSVTLERLLAFNDSVTMSRCQCKYYVVVVYLNSLLLITYILTSVATASTAAALKVTADRNILVPVVPEGKQ